MEEVVARSCWIRKLSSSSPRDSSFVPATLCLLTRGRYIHLLLDHLLTEKERDRETGRETEREREDSLL